MFYEYNRRFVPGRVRFPGMALIDADTATESLLCHTPPGETGYCQRVYADLFRHEIYSATKKIKHIDRHIFQGWANQKQRNQCCVSKSKSYSMAPWSFLLWAFWKILQWHMLCHNQHSFHSQIHRPSLSQGFPSGVTCVCLIPRLVNTDLSSVWRRILGVRPRRPDDGSDWASILGWDMYTASLLLSEHELCISELREMLG